MRVLVVGGGGREHALCRALAASPLVGAVFCAPGNAGIRDAAALIDVAADDIEGLIAAASNLPADLVVIGPERPLTLALVDRLEAAGIRAFGPSAAAARLEGSKAFAKDFCRRHGIPTAGYRVFDASEAEAARAYLRGHPLPIVVKADGLAAGKGVVVAATADEALTALDAAFAGAFCAAGGRVVIEECLTGEEASLFALSDGANVVEIGTAQDHKRALDGDRGPNTGGMGAFSPAPALTPELTRQAMDAIVRPTIRGMAAEKAPFRGVLYAGLMLTEDGPKLIEFNVRFGDPEAQAVLPRLENDLAALMLAAVDGELGGREVYWRPEHALTVVLASRGYPGSHEPDGVIGGLDRAAALPGVRLFHAGTREAADGGIVAAGGRVLGVTGVGPDLATARDRAYAAVAAIEWPGGFWRSDIGRRASGRPSG